MNAPFSPKLVKGGLVLVDPQTAQVQRVISLQYNAESLKRSLKSQDAGGDGGDRSGEGEGLEGMFARIG